MIIVKNVLIEIADKYMSFKKVNLPVYKHFNNADYLGYAALERRENGIYADFYLNEKPGEDQLYPAIGYSQNPDIIDLISLCYNQNVDHNIKPIRFDLLS